MKIIKASVPALLIVLALVFATGCKKKNANGNPDNDVQVTTYKPTDISETTAVSGCDVEVLQGLTLTKIGVCWSTSANPTASDSQLSTENWDEPFVCTLTGLASGTTYHVRAFALRGLEYYYGDDRTFTTLGSGNGGNGGNGGGGLEPPTPFGPGSGTASDPYNVASVIQLPSGQTEFWARGYIVGGRGNGTMFSTEPPFENEGIVYIADDPNESDRNNCVGFWITSYNDVYLEWVAQGALTNHPENLGKCMTFCAKKNTSDIAHLYLFSFSLSGSGLATSLPAVETQQVTATTSTSATLSGKVVSEGGAVTRRGFCWSTSANPTVDDATRDCGTGLGSFTLTLSGLSPNTTYHVRAFAVNSLGESYGDDVQFATASGSGGSTCPTGAVNGLFSVSDSKQVWFSQGNLQYKASSNTWRFAEEQWHFVGTSYSENPDYVGGNVSGSSNHRVSSSYSGWIDWFCWATSGYNHGAIAYQPWATSGRVDDFKAYGITNSNLYDQTGKADWGYNKISNGGNQENYGWRTPTKDEWEYLINGRNTPSGIRYVFAKVNGVYGLLLLPDNWSTSIYTLNYPNMTVSEAGYNVISASDWANKLVKAGAVFLPTTGYRLRNKPTDNDSFYFAPGDDDNYWNGHRTHSLYWSSTYLWVFLKQCEMVSLERLNVCYGISVRLVKDY